MKFIKKYKSYNFSKRKNRSSLKYIIIHYTAMLRDFEAIHHLCNKKNKVSSHFLINKEGKIYYLVDLKNRAWHAGDSFWYKKRDINSESIGIEIDNSGHHILFENYTSAQINSLISLLKFLIKKYKINPKHILGHSDIAPYRKIDPGEKFPWGKLYKNKLIFLPKSSIKKKNIELSQLLLKKFNNNKKKTVLFILKSIGYNIGPAARNEKKYNILVKAYQMHYRQKKISGKIDIETYQLLLSHYNAMNS